MKKLSTLLLGALCMLAACSKKDKTPPEGQQPAEAYISRIIAPGDTLAFTYGAGGTLQRFRHYGDAGFFPDSTQVTYAGEQPAAFRIWVMGDAQPRNDRTFQYNASQQLTRIHYYNLVSETELAITDYDSLVYEQGKLAALHAVNGASRNEVYRFTWEKDNVSEVKFFEVIGGAEQLVRVTTFTYTDKPALGGSLPKYLLFLDASARDFAALSANAPLRSRTVLHPDGAVQEERQYAYTVNSRGLPEKIDETVTWPGMPAAVEQTAIEYLQKGQ